MLALVNRGTFDSATGGTFQSDTDGTFHSDIPGTFESDMDGTFKVLQSFKIDRDNNSVDEERIGEEGNVREYVEGIITQINDNDGDRRYEFKDTELTMKACLDAIISDNNRDVQSSFIANRLLEVEKDAQEKVAKLTDIQKGILLIAYCKMTDDVVNSEHTHPEKRPPFRGITTQNTSIFIEKGVRIREIAQVFRSNATQPLSIAF